MTDQAIEEILAQAFATHPVGMIFGVGFVILCFYFGIAVLFNGWPEFRRRK